LRPNSGEIDDQGSDYEDAGGCEARRLECDR
jgi:hypothetical protein